VIATFETIDMRRPDQFPVPINAKGLKLKARDLWLCPIRDPASVDAWIPRKTETRNGRAEQLPSS
jgi:hypothetical protein